jgi:hypothetical protein
VLILSKTQVQNLDVVTDALQKIRSGPQKAGHVGDTRPGRVRKAYVATLPWLCIS